MTTFKVKEDEFKIELGDSAEKASGLYGDKIVFVHYERSAKNQAISIANTMLKKGKSAVEIQKSFLTYKPTLLGMRGMTDEEKELSRISKLTPAQQKAVQTALNAKLNPQAAQAEAPKQPFTPRPGGPQR